MAPFDPFSYSCVDLTGLFSSRYGKGTYHAVPFFRSLYSRGTGFCGDLKEFHANPGLALKVRQDFDCRIPVVKDMQRDSSSIKILLQFPDGVLIETVVLFMTRYASICVSTQAGCARGCTFCETGSLGLIRNLTAGEIVGQLMAVRFYLGITVSNLVFMGMGEPFDNLENVIKAIEIISDQRGCNIPVSSMTVSTAGHVPGIRELASHIRAWKSPDLKRLSLAVSLHSADNQKRCDIMPINRIWPLEELKQAMKEYPLARGRDRIFMEYTLIPGVNDSPEDARQLVDYLMGMQSCVNIIPCNPGTDGRYRRPSRDQVDLFASQLLELGQYCRIRDTRGDSIQAACGQLGSLTRNSMGP